MFSMVPGAAVVFSPSRGNWDGCSRSSSLLGVLFSTGGSSFVSAICGGLSVNCGGSELKSSVCTPSGRSDCGSSCSGSSTDRSEVSEASGFPSDGGAVFIMSEKYFSRSFSAR